MPKFDVIIMNPPYSKNLHLNILEKVIHFEITGYINDNLAEPNSEWELILNTIKEYNEKKDN